MLGVNVGTSLNDKHRLDEQNKYVSKFIVIHLIYTTLHKDAF